MIFGSRVRGVFSVAVIACVAVLSCFGPVTGQVIQKSEDFTVDPGWDELGNRSDGQDFGYSATNNAGGSVGEAGGHFSRESLGIYADNVGSIDPSTTTLTMTGTGVWTAEGGGSGNVMIGWFDKFADLHWQPKNFIGFRTDTADLYLCISDTSCGPKVNGGGIDPQTPFTYDLTFDPAGAGGNGSITSTFNVTSNGVLETYNPTLDAEGGVIDSFNDLNRHGLFTLWIPGNDTQIDFAVDDITYTAAPAIADPTDYTWNGSGGGSWGVATNWDLGFLPDSAATTIFGSTIGQPSTVYTTSDVNIAGVKFNSANSYGIAGNGEVTTASVDVDLGHHAFQAAVNLGPSANVDVATNTSVTFDNALNLGGNTATKTGSGTMLVNNDLPHLAISGSVDVQGGTLGGGGRVGGSLSSSGGTVAPGEGESAGLLVVNGNYSQDGSSSLEIEIGGLVSEDQHDVLAVLGGADLAGTLAVSLIDGFTPTAGQQFTVLTSSGITNSGLSLSGPGASMFSLDVGASNVILEFGAASLAGDYNGDGTVNAADYTLWQDTLGQNVAAGSGADGNGDGTINASDYGVWKTNFGTTSGSATASGAAVPEPTNLVLLCTGLIGLWTWLRTGGKVMRCGLRGRVFLMALAVGVISIGAAGSAQADLKVETFDSDPGWQAMNNISPSFAYEYYWLGNPATNFAAGQSPGEIGGWMPTRDFTSPSYFADDVGTLDPSTDALTVAGKGVIQSNDGGFTLFGWFDKDSNLTWTNADGSSNFLHFVGLRTDDDRVMLWSDGGATKITQPGVGNPFTFSFTYDPNANGGDGAVMGNVNGGAMVTRNFAPGTKDAINNLDSFGMLANEHLQTTSRLSEWYYDDLVYTTSFAQPAITEVAWGGDFSGNGASGGSWSPPVPPTSSDITAVLGDIITGPQTVFADTDMTMNTLRIDNANEFVLAGQATLNLVADTGSATLEVLQGSHESQIEVSLGSDLDVTVAAGASFSFNNGLDLNGFKLNFSGAGSLEINNTLTLDGGAITGPVTNNVVGIPEPSTVILLGLAVVAFGPAVLRKRRHTK
jgi:hypothetical protein